MSQWIKGHNLGVVFVSVVALVTLTMPRAINTAGQKTKATNRVGKHVAQNLQSPRQCSDAPFVVPAEYVHASYGGTPSWPHPGVDFTGRTTDLSKARQPTSSACPENGTWDLGVPGEAPVYAAYDGFVDGFHYAQDGTLIGIYIRHENVPVSGRIEPVVCTYYEHMGNADTGESTIFSRFHARNSPVEKGEQIGWIGNRSGSGSTFAHLHFGVGIGLYGSDCQRPYELQWYTDPSPFLGFNVNQDNGARRYCYQVGCPPIGQCCCSTYSAASDESSNGHGFCTSELVPTEPLSPTDNPFDQLPTIIPTTTPLLALTTTTPTINPTMIKQQTIAQVNIAYPASTHYRLARSVFGTGGGHRTSTHYTVQGTSGQTSGVDRRESSSYVLQSGYWSSLAVASHDHAVYLPLVLKQD